jgi:sugar phosphate isomerase/epimerase
MGYDGVTLRGLQGELHLPACPSLAGHPREVARRFADAGVELVCLETGNCFHWKDRKKQTEQKAQAREFIELAGALGCPFVRVYGDEIPRYEQRESTLVRVADALSDLAPMAASHNVTILLENHGDFAGSRDVWFILDRVSHPAVAGCWHPCHAKAVGEKHTLAIPRLGTKIALVLVVDAKFTEAGALDAYTVSGDGDVDYPRFFDILRGIAYQGYLVFHWPKLWNLALAEPDVAFPAALVKLRAMLDALDEVKELSAYKGDKNAPKYPSTHRTANA